MAVRATLVSVTWCVTSLHNHAAADIGVTGAENIASALLGNTTVTSLDISGKSERVQKFKYNKIRQSEGAGEEPYDNPPLSAAENNIGQFGASAIAKMFKQNHRITSVNLSRALHARRSTSCNLREVTCAVTCDYVAGNDFGTAGASALADVLKANTAIVTIDIIGANAHGRLVWIPLSQHSLLTQTVVLISRARPSSRRR